jgi:hypothetical protein
VKVGDKITLKVGLQDPSMAQPVQDRTVSPCCSQALVTNMAEYATVIGDLRVVTPEKSHCRWRSAAPLPPASDYRWEGPLS